MASMIPKTVNPTERLIGYNNGCRGTSTTPYLHEKRRPKIWMRKDHQLEIRIIQLAVEF